MKGKTKGQFTYPMVPGVEGSGTVVASGGGWWSWYLQGKRVGFYREAEEGNRYSKHGSYAEYVVTNAN